MRKRLAPSAQTSNKLLNLLSPRDYARIAPELELIELRPGDVLLGRFKIDQVYFPTSGIIAKTVTMANGDQIEAGMIGNEGMVPLCLFLGLDLTPFQATVQNTGQALRMSAKAFDRHIQPGGMLHAILLRFAAAFMAQVSLSAACKGLHPLRAQLCRWLLMMHDRMGSPEFTLTQERIAEMLGVRRMSITAVARQLQAEGVIEYRRGRIKILNVRALMLASCECYGRARKVYDSLIVDRSSETRRKRTRRS